MLITRTNYAKACKQMVLSFVFLKREDIVNEISNPGESSHRVSALQSSIGKKDGDWYNYP